ARPGRARRAAGRPGARQAGCAAGRQHLGRGHLERRLHRAPARAGHRGRRRTGTGARRRLRAGHPRRDAGRGAGVPRRLVHRYRHAGRHAALPGRHQVTRASDQRRPTMKLLFSAVCPTGFGETLIGVSLADQLRKLGVTSHFIIEPHALRTLVRSTKEPGHAYTVLEPQMGPLAKLLVDDAIATFRPDAIVLADYLTHCRAFTRTYHLDPWFIESHGVPVIPIDIWELEKTSYRIDLATDDVTEVNEHFRDLPAQLRPVPLAHLEPDGTCRARPFRLWDRDDRVSARTRNHLRTTLGLEKQDKLVMLATAAWQLGKGIKHRKQVLPVRDGMPRILAHYLQQLPPRTHFLLAGEAPDALAELPGDRIHRLPPCLPERFGNLLGAADAILSMNISATTVTRAVMAGVPAMVLSNRFDIADPEDAEKADADLG